MNNKEKAVIFDLGNVLVHVDYGLSTPKIAALLEGNFTQDQLEELLYGVTKKNGWAFQGDQTKLYEQYHSGNISTQDFLTQILTNATLKPGTSIEDMRTAWPAKFDRIEKTIALLPELAHHHLYILSDTNEMDADWLQTHYPDIFTHFDQIFFSHQKHINKYSHQAWKNVLAESELPAEQHVFIDDKADHVGRAIELGIHGIVFTDPDALRKELLVLGYL